MDSEEFSANKNSDRDFGLVFAVVFVIITSLQFHYTGYINYIVIFLAIMCIILAFLFPAMLRPFNRLWLKFGFLLNKIMSPLIMSIVFFLVVTPIGLCLRLIRKNLLDIGFDHQSKSYWKTYESNDLSSMKNQF